MNDQREEPLKTHIRRQMLEKETRELREIGKLNDRKEWSDAAFEVIREILAERLGEVPTQSGSGADIVEDEFEDKYHKTDKLWNISLWANTITGESTGKGVLLPLFLGFGPLLLLLAFNWLSPYPKLVVSAESLEYLTWTNRLSTAWENIATIGLMPAFIGGSEHEGAVLSQPGTQGSKLPLGLGLARSWRARFIPLSIFGWWRYHDLGQQIARHAPWLLQSPLRDRTETPILDKNPKTEEC